MPAYNPPPQVLFSPVTNYYQGKAIRQQLAAGEQDMAIKKKQMEQSDEKLDLERKRAELSERQVKIQEESFDLNREKFENEVGKEAASRAAFDAYSITQEVDGLFQAGGKTPEAEAESLQVAAEGFTRYAESLPDGEQKDGLLAKLQDGLTADEYRTIRPAVERAAGYYGHIGEDKLTTVAKGTDVINSSGEVVYSNIDEGGKPTRSDGDAIKLLDGNTPESVDKWMETGNFSDLVPRDGDESRPKLTEGQSKGSGWYNQALTGNKLIEDQLNAGLEITPRAVAVYAESIDDTTGNINRQLLRTQGVTEDEIRFFDAVNLMVDPVVRQSTGAAVKTFEFLLWFNSLVPQSNDPKEIAQKSFVRGRVIAGLNIAAGPGAALVDKLHEDVPTPNFEDAAPAEEYEEGTIADGPDGEIIYRNGAWERNK
jgi:hypothetical protein